MSACIIFSFLKNPIKRKRFLSHVNSNDNSLSKSTINVDNGELVEVEN